MTAPMTIADLARASGIDVASIQVYEKRGFLSPSSTGAEGEALYRESDMAVLTFILRARGLGFSLEATRELLDLTERQPGHGCADVYDVIDRQLHDIRRRIAELANLERLLAPLAMAPRRGGIDDCPILITLQQPA